jgi:hypothetical protein
MPLSEASMSLKTLSLLQEEKKVRMENAQIERM